MRVIVYRAWSRNMALLRSTIFKMGWIASGFGLMKRVFRSSAGSFWNHEISSLRDDTWLLRPVLSRVLRSSSRDATGLNM
jgi:hypothetical protein